MGEHRLAILLLRVQRRRTAAPVVGDDRPELAVFSGLGQ
ncbi:hypothetical protein A33M_2471 [Rhodovulum sp. PH10]|nr:hypothetical protein A33M_2471 [Rhodovulum sp. PH10]